MFLSQTIMIARETSFLNICITSIPLENFDEVQVVSLLQFRQKLTFD